MAILHAFGADRSEGFHPPSLMRSADGAYYGTTEYGGNGHGGFTEGGGTAFRMTAHGRLTTIHKFKAGAEGVHPFVDALAPGIDGMLYGVCERGGKTGAFWMQGMGTVFRIAP
jgi:hypothetical protein